MADRDLPNIYIGGDGRKKDDRLDPGPKRGKRTVARAQARARSAASDRQRIQSLRRRYNEVRGTGRT